MSYAIRLTVPAREALVRAGNEVEAGAYGTPVVTLRRPPRGLVLVLVGHGAEQHLALRCEDEPAYPGEWPADAVPWWERGCWVPCPQCGATLLWDEAGRVPGARVCLDGHSAQLAHDGRTAVQS